MTRSLLSFNTLVIAWKELRVYFGSPIAYVVMAAFLVFSGLLFIDSISGVFREAALRGFFVGESLAGTFGEAINGTFLVLLLGPVLTMRLLAEETKLGTIELLLTAPIRDFEVVLGKFLAAFVIVLILIAMTLYYPILLWLFASPDGGPIFSGYFGLVLLGALFVAVGVFASSLTNNQIVSAVVALVILLMFWFIDEAADFFSGTAASVLEFVSPRSHFTDFARGIIDTEAIIYFISLTAIFLFLTIRSLESRRWR